MSTTRNWEWMMKVILVHVLQFPLKEHVCEQILLPIPCQFRVGDGKSCTSRVHEPWNGWEVGIPFNSGWEYIEIWPNGANNVTNTTGKLWVKSSWGRPLILYDLHIFSIFPIYCISYSTSTNSFNDLWTAIERTEVMSTSGWRLQIPKPNPPCCAPGQCGCCGRGW